MNTEEIDRIVGDELAYGQHHGHYMTVVLAAWQLAGPQNKVMLWPVTE